MFRIFNSISSMVSDLTDAGSAGVKGLSTEAQHWAKRRRATQALRDDIYIKEQVEAWEKSQRKFEKLNVSQEALTLLENCRKKMAE